MHPAQEMIIFDCLTNNQDYHFPQRGHTKETENKFQVTCHFIVYTLSWENVVKVAWCSNGETGALSHHYHACLYDTVVEQLHYLSAWWRFLFVASHSMPLLSTNMSLSLSFPWSTTLCGISHMVTFGLCFNNFSRSTISLGLSYYVSINFMQWTMPCVHIPIIKPLDFLSGNFVK